MNPLLEDLNRDLFYFKLISPLEYYLMHKYFNGSWPFQFMRMTLRDTSKVSCLWGVLYSTVAFKIGLAEVMKHESPHDFIVNHEFWCSSKPKFKFLSRASQNLHEKKYVELKNDPCFKFISKELAKAISERTLPAYIYNRCIPPEKQGKEPLRDYCFNWELNLASYKLLQKRKRFLASMKKSKKTKSMTTVKSSRISCGSTKQNGKTNGRKIR